MTSMWCNRPNGRSIRLLTVTEATACQAVEHSHDTIQFEAVSARHPSQSRAKTPQALCAEFNYGLNRRTMEPELMVRLLRACICTQTITYKQLVAMLEQA